MGSILYNDLGVPVDATAEEIRSAYHQAAKRYHPDTNPNEQDQERFLAIQEAYQILSSEKRRAEYDANLPKEVHYHPAINVNATYSLSSIPRLTEKQIVYALLEVRAVLSHESTMRPPAHICLVIDRSTSMQGERMDMVRQNISELLPKLQENDLISLVTFSDRAEVLLAPISPRDTNAIVGAIRNVTTGGGTELYYGLREAYELLNNSPRSVGIRQAMVLTDGQTYGDEETCLQLAHDAYERGIEILAFGIGNEWNDRFLDQLTAISGEQAIFVRTPKDLYNYLDEKLRSLDLLFAKAVTLSFDLGPHVHLQYAFRLQPSEAPLLIEPSTVLGEVQYGKTLRVLFELSVDPLPESLESLVLLQGRMVMDIPSRPIKKFRIYLNLERTVKPLGKRETIPGVLVQSISKLNLYRLQEKARVDVEEGDFDRAKRRLDYLATQLLQMGDHELASTVRREAEHIHRTGAFSKEGDKQIKYGTRALFLLPASETKTL